MSLSSAEPRRAVGRLSDSPSDHKQGCVTKREAAGGTIPYCGTVESQRNKMQAGSKY